MKKFLFASTALVMTAGVAAAEVTVGGDGRMGILYTETAGVSDTAFTSRIRISFTASGETDGGLAFGGSIRADNSVAGAAGTAGSVYISGAFGKLSMGDVSGAAESAVGDVSGVGLTGVGDRNEMVYLNNVTRPNALYTYTTGAVTLYASVENPTGGNSGYSVAAKYDTDTWGVGLGYESQDAGTPLNFPAFGVVAYAPATDVSQIIAGGWGSFGGVKVKAIYGEIELDGFTVTQWALSGDYTMGATTVTAFYGMSDDSLGTEPAYYGIGASYDLGGGASLKGGVSHNDFLDSTIADFGVAMSF